MSADPVLIAGTQAARLVESTGATKKVIRRRLTAAMPGLRFAAFFPSSPGFLVHYFYRDAANADMKPSRTAWGGYSGS
ncbi:hypothetical protein ABTK41_19480, partial [Acinetobacter baumannii]